MPFFRKEWRAREAEEWTREDTFTIIVSPLVYVLVLIGCAMSALLIPAGFVILAAGVIIMVIMIRVIDPKLSAVSKDYEKKQKEYLEDLERKVKWEE